LQNILIKELHIQRKKPHQSAGKNYVLAMGGYKESKI
jgi:hypothetical protein